jgi:hypothetical protein
LTGLPAQLTPSIIRKYYPHNDPIKSKSQLSKRPIPNHPIKNYDITYCGEQVEIDILMISTPTSSIPKANGGFRHVVLVVDVFSSFLSYVPIKSMKKPHRFIETIVTNYQNHGFPIKHLKMDNQFNTIEILSYLDSLHITYQFSPPYEHEFIGRIERNIEQLRINYHVL